MNEDTHKHCRQCDTTLPRTEYHKNRTAKDGLQVVCKECNKANSKKMWRNARQRKMHRNNVYRRRYGQTYDEKMALLKGQGNRCACCGTDMTSRPSHHVHLDHCHTSGDPRGVLCAPCNIGLGYLENGRIGVTTERNRSMYEAYLEGCA